MRSTKKPKMKQCPCCGADVYEDELRDVDPDVPRRIEILQSALGIESFPYEQCERDPRRNRIIVDTSEEIIWMQGRVLYCMRKGVRERE